MSASLTADAAELIPEGDVTALMGLLGRAHGVATGWGQEMMRIINRYQAGAAREGDGMVFETAKRRLLDADRAADAILIWARQEGIEDRFPASPWPAVIEDPVTGAVSFEARERAA